MFDSIKNNLKNIASGILAVGCICSFVLGFILIVALNQGYKLIGLGLWFVGPFVSLISSIVVYGVAIKYDEYQLKCKQSDLLEMNNKKLDRIIVMLKKNENEENEVNQNTKQNVSSNINQNTNYGSASGSNYSSSNSSFSSINNMKKESDVKVNSIFENNTNPFSNTNNIANEQKQEVKAEVKEKANNYDNIADLYINVNDCVLFSNYITLPIGETINLSNVTELRVNGTNLLFYTNSKTYSIDFNEEGLASLIYDKIINKMF